MSKEYLKLFNDVYFKLSNQLSCFMSSNLNINLNFDHKLKEVHASVVNNHLEEMNLMLLGHQLSELHTMLDMKLKHIEEVNLMCSKQSKAFLDFSNEQTEALNNSQNLSDAYSDVDSLNCGMIQSKLKTNELSFPGMKMYDIKNPLILNRSDSVVSKKMPSSRYSDDSILNSMSCRVNDSGPLLRKKINFKPNKHKAKKFIPFKKQALFKSSKDSNLTKKSSNIRLPSNDSKYSSFNKKRKRLSLSNSLLYNKRTRNQPNKSSCWDHEDTRVYCICNKPSYGDMIACDSEKCKIEWFHYKCVDITTSPKGDWFCPMCKMD